MSLGRILRLIALAGFLALLASCWYGPDNNPKAVTQKFLKALQQGAYDKAMEMATDDQKLLLNYQKMNFLRLSPPEAIKEVVARASQVITITSFDEAKETARVYCSYDGRPAEALNLFKKDGKWLVSGW